MDKRLEAQGKPEPSERAAREYLISQDIRYVSERWRGQDVKNLADLLTRYASEREGQGIDWETQNKLAQAAEKKDCEKALLALAGWYPTPVEGYGFNTSWAISDLCRAISELRAAQQKAPGETK